MKPKISNREAVKGHIFEPNKLHKMGHLETTTAISSLNQIYLKILLSGR